MKLTPVLVLTLLLFFGTAVVTNYSYAAGFSLGGVAGGIAGGLTKSPYGGRVLMTIPCTCPGDLGRKYLVTIGPPSPGIYLVDLLTVVQKPHLYGMWIVPTVFHLGYREMAIPPTECKMYAVEGCFNMPYQYKVIEAGTSRPF